MTAEGNPKRQYLATLILNLLPLNFGAACGWTSPAFLELTSETDPLFSSGPITPTEASWIGSVVSLGGIAGTLVFGDLADRIGRKWCLLITALPLMASWILIIIADDVTTLCIARFICGFGAGGIFILTPLFIAEIADVRIRGTLGSSIVVSCNLGILIMFILATFLPFKVYSAVFLVCPTAFFFIVLFYLPETPRRLLAVNKFAEAEKALQFYNSDKSVRLTSTLKSGTESPDSDCFGEAGMKARPLSVWQELRSSGIRKAFLIGTVMMWFNQFCGLFTMMTFAGSIFRDAGSSISPNMSSICVAVIQLLGSYCSTICVDRFGRKILLAASGIGIFLGLTGLGLYTYCKVELMMDMSSISWISLVCFCFPIFIGNCGIMALPFVIVSEIFPERIKRIASTYCMVVMHFLAFTAVKYFPIVSSQLGPHYGFFFFGSCALIGALFAIFCMPETKGKSFEEIEKLLNK